MKMEFLKTREAELQTWADVDQTAATESEVEKSR